MSYRKATVDLFGSNYDLNEKRILEIASDMGYETAQFLVLHLNEKNG